jgi:hypothetical protein
VHERVTHSAALEPRLHRDRSEAERGYARDVAAGRHAVADDLAVALDHDGEVREPTVAPAQRVEQAGFDRFLRRAPAERGDVDRPHGRDVTRLFAPAADAGIEAPDPAWGVHFQVRTLSAYEPEVRGRFTYAQPFADL